MYWQAGFHFRSLLSSLPLGKACRWRHLIFNWTTRKSQAKCVRKSWNSYIFYPNFQSPIPIELLGDLAGTLVSHNVQQSNTLGTVEGTVEDVMYGVVATTDAALKIKSSSVNDGMLDTKMLRELVKSSREEPFRHVGIKWKLYSGRDYVSLDATGVLYSKNERIGYNLAHSVAFPDFPDFQSHGVLRSNMSVCSLYRQKTPTSVEIYVRGFFDFPTANEMLNNVALQALASQWLSFGQKVEYGRMKKLMWGLRRNSIDSRSSDTSSSSCESSNSSREPTMRPGVCALCSNSFGFLGTSRETCTSCGRIVCPRCTVKKIVHCMAVDGRTVEEKKSLFCRRCIENVRESDTLAITREAYNQDAEVA